MTLEGIMGPSMALEGSSTAEVFEAYLEHFLVSGAEAGRGSGDGQPAGRPHKPKRVRELIEDRGSAPASIPAGLLVAGLQPY
jgi:hypothetical protein